MKIITADSQQKKKEQPQQKKKIVVKEPRSRTKFLDEKYLGEEPTWDDVAPEKYRLRLIECLNWYNYFYTNKDLKPVTLLWCKNSGEFTKQELDELDTLEDYRFPVTLGSLVKMLQNGMPEEHNERNHNSYILDRVKEIHKVYYKPVIASTTESKNRITIQDRILERALFVCSGIDDWLESFYENKKKFDPKGFDVIKHLRSQQVNAAHARYIKKNYQIEFNELKELLFKKTDTQEYKDLAESYEGHSKIEIKKLYEAYLEIDTACNLIIEDKKIEKQQKPKVKKEVSKTKIIEKLKYQIRDDNLKVVSINPVDIIGAKELWVFNTKTRKIGKYIAINTLTVKGTHILGFDEEKSIQKTLRKPIETLTEFKATGKVALRKFMDNINSVDIKLTGKINTDILLLKVIKE